MKMLLFLMLSSVLNLAHARDIYGQSRYIEIKMKKDRISFKLCKLHTSYCEQLGPRSSYSIQKLKKQRTIEGGQVPAAIVGDVVTFVGMLAGAAVGGGSIGGIIIATGVVDHYVTALNPVDQYRQYHALRDEVLEDKTIWATDEDITQVVTSLSQVLEKL